MPRFNANIRWLFKEYDGPQRFVMAARCGFKGVEHGDPYEWKARDVATWLADNGLEMVQILTPQNWAGGETGLATLPGREGDFRDAVRRGIDYAVEIKCKLLHTAIGPLTASDSRERCWARLVDNLAHACDQARMTGLTVIIEPVCSARFADFFVHRLDEGVALIRDVGRDNLKLCFDTYHVQMEEGAISANLERVWPHVGHLQLGNPPGRNEPGVGELNLEHYFDLVDRLGWKGWIGCEYVSSGHTLDSLAWGAAYGIRKPAP
jgi:hydroxypyruvate isomerase